MGVSLAGIYSLSIEGLNEKVSLNAKLSIQKEGDEYKLKIHPVNNIPKNNLNLTETEIDFLKKDPLNIVPKAVVNKDGKLTEAFISLDKSTNEYVAAVVCMHFCIL